MKVILVIAVVTIAISIYLISQSALGNLWETQVLMGVLIWFLIYNIYKCIKRMTQKR